MRHIERVREPDILVRKRVEWQEKFDERRAADSHARPDSSKYGHPDIKDALVACSSDKCFYCESKLSGDGEIDHFIEVAIAPDLAYTWTNLYLSCRKCNDKFNHNVIPVEDVLDPCNDSDAIIQDNITFEDECICSQPDSVIGLNTIKKFRLDSEQMDYKRSRWLIKIMKAVDEIKGGMIEEGRKYATDEEKRRLKLYMQKDQPYSLMSEIFIKKNFAKLIA